MAIESLTDWVFSSQSDVWAFGVVLWEIFSLAKVPYPGMPLNQLIEGLQNGYRMGKPEFAPDAIGELMSDCWKTQPNQRPTFSQLEEALTSLMDPQTASNYIAMNGPYIEMNSEHNKRLELNMNQLIAKYDK